MAFPLHAEVIDVQPSGFVSKNEALISASPEDVYRALLRVGQWWDPEHTYSGDPGEMRIDARPGGCFCERIPGKGAIEHMRVAYVSKNSTLRLFGALGPLQELGVAGSLTWSLKAEGGGTKFVQTYNVGGYRQGGFADLAPLVDQVLNTQLQRLKGYIETE
ncbi:MAG: SRPBCC domain-containing protein [Gammaproteobacteria bacterium]|nr:SRPBCC domain-containing protein [Gammaproteobacteria bacterium]